MIRLRGVRPALLCWHRSPLQQQPVSVPHTRITHKTAQPACPDTLIRTQMAVSERGSVFFPPGVRRVKFRHGMPGMWRWLCVSGRTIPKILVEPRARTMPRSSLAALFCMCVRTMRRHRIPACLQLAANGKRMSLQCHTKIKYIGVAGNIHDAKAASEAQERSVETQTSGQTTGVLSCSCAFGLCPNRRGAKIKPGAISHLLLQQEGESTQETLSLLPRASSPDKIPASDVQRLPKSPENRAEVSSKCACRKQGQRVGSGGGFQETSG